MIKNMKLGLRLGAGFGIIIVLIIIMAVFSIIEVVKISGKIDLIVNERFPKTIVSQIIIDELNTVARVLRDMVIIKNESEIEKQARRLDEAREKITKSINELESSMKDDEGRRCLEKVSVARSEYLPVQTKIKNLTFEGKKDEATAILLGDFITVQNSYIDAVSKLIEYQIKLTNHDGNNAMRLADTVKISLIILSCIILVIGMLAAIVITKSIVAPLNKCIDIAEKVAKGKTDMEINVDSTDETGILLSAMEKMVKSIKELIDDAGLLAKAAVEGKLSARADVSKHEGDFKKIIQGVNDTLDSVIGPLNVSAKYVEAISKGNIPERITDNYNGDFNTIKNNLNQCVDAVNRLVSDTDLLVQAALQGKLSTRADASKHLGDFRKIVEGVNQTLDAVINPVNEASAVLEKVAARDLSVRVTSDYKGDHAKIKNALNSAVDNLDKALQQVSDATEQVSSASQQISAGSQSLAQGANQQASSLEEISSSLEEMSSMTKQNADNAMMAKNLAGESNTNAKSGSEAMVRMSGAINRIKESSDQTAKIVKTIDEIAMQTNLLALNAAVEAARAGEAGRGFAVVAEEVRNLAQRSAQAAKNTADMISESVKNADDGVKIASEVAQSFESIATSAKKVNDLIAEIAAASQEQSQGIDQVNTAVAQMDKVTQQNAANSEESASAAEELSSQAEGLQGMVGQFNLTHSNTGVRQMANSAKLSSHNSHQVPIKRRYNSDSLKNSQKKNIKSDLARAEELIPLDDEILKEF